MSHEEPLLDHASMSSYQASSDTSGRTKSSYRAEIIIAESSSDMRRVPQRPDTIGRKEAIVLPKMT